MVKKAQSPRVGGAVKGLRREGDGHQQFSVLDTSVQEYWVVSVHFVAGFKPN